MSTSPIKSFPMVTNKQNVMHKAFPLSVHASKKEKEQNKTEGKKSNNFNNPEIV
jgi:hypothetical protein